MIIARQKIYAQPPFYYTRELEENDWPDAIAVLSCSNRLVSFPRSCFIGGSAPRQPAVATPARLPNCTSEVHHAVCDRV